VHDEPAEVSASALDPLLCIELEAVAIEEWPRGKTGVGRNSRGADRTQCQLDALVEPGGNTTTSKSGMSEKKVEVAVVCVGSETCKATVRLGDDGVKMRKALLPASGVGWNWRPRSNLLRRVVRRCQRPNRSGVNLHNAWQVGGLIWSFFHRERAETPNENKISHPPQAGGAELCNAQVSSENPQLIFHTGQRACSRIYSELAASLGLG
jgi:hypothetical protein